MRAEARSRAAWPEGIQRFGEQRPPAQGRQEAEENGEKAESRLPPAPAWTARAISSALKAGARNLGAPEGWGWRWGGARIFDAVSNLLPMADVALWGELVWALGAHPQGLREVVACVRRETNPSLSAVNDRPLHWPGGRSFTLDASEEGLGEGWLLAQWVERYAIARQMGVESAWREKGCGHAEKERAKASAFVKMSEEMDACLAIWATAGGTLSRKLHAAGAHDGARRQMIYAARCRLRGYLMLAAQERALGAEKALALLRAGAPLDETEDHCLAGWLCVAAARPDAVEIFKAADHAGADFNAAGAFGGTPLHEALNEKNGPAFDWLAERATGLSGAAALRRAQVILARSDSGLRYGGRAAGMRADQPDNQRWLGRRIAQAEARELRHLVPMGESELVACRATRL